MYLWEAHRPTDVVFLVLTITYAVDLVVRFYGLGLRSFRANGWNLFDVIVIAGSLATTIPSMQATAAGIPPNQVNGQLQKLFLVSIALKLVQRSSALNQLFKTSMCVELGLILEAYLIVAARVYRPLGIYFYFGVRSSSSLPS